jgi:transposase
MAAAPWIVSEELWELIEPLLPKVERRFRYPGRKRLRIGRRCRGSCLCCIRGSRGRICRSSWASALV